jgi:TonB-linked SusC/RagA family outer membrane protein
MRKLQPIKLWKIIILIISVNCFSFSLFAQNPASISGKVVDEKGEPLPGATIRYKNNNASAVSTDYNGNFTIKTSPGGTVLVASFTGYLSREIAISSINGALKISLVPDVKALVEVAVIGYQSKQKALVTGAMSTLDAKTISEASVTSIDQALQGRVAGLVMTQNSGTPGGGSSIQIRGLNSINSTNEPIYVIDGVIISSGTGSYYQNAFSSINPSDIESIDVLKDASATAIYGAQGANGVIIVTTKRGRVGAPQLTVDSKFTTQQVPRYLPMADLQAYAIHYNAVAAIRNLIPNSNFADPSLLGPGTNWQKEIFGPAPMQNYNFSLLGGSENTTYKLAGGYLNQNGIAAGSSFRRITLNTAIDSKVKNWFKLGASMNFNTTKQVTTIGDWGLIYNAVGQSPTVPAFNLDGSYGGPENPNDGFLNPLALAQLIDNGSKGFGVLGNVYAEVRPAKWLTYRTEFASSMDQQLYHSYVPTYQLGGVYNSQITNNQSQRFSVNWTWRNLLTFDRKIAKYHSVNVLLGQEMTQRTSNYLWAQRYGGNNLVTDIDAGDATTASNAGNSSRSGILSYFSRLSYSYKDKYLLTATLRNDGTSNFAPGHQWGFFPSASVGWRVTEEKFMKKFKTINNLKLRFGYGKVGNSNVIPFAYAAILTNSPTIYGPGHLVANVPNPDLSWEKTDSYNAGFDLGLFNDRIQFTFDAYSKRTNDLLLQLTLPAYTGTGTLIVNQTTPPWANAGAMENRGLEFSLTTVNIQKNGFKWSSNFIYSLNRNKVVKLNTENALLYGTYQVSGNNIIITKSIAGQSIGDFYGYKVIGRINSAADLTDAKGNKVALPAGATVAPGGTWVGDLLFDDFNHDGVINELDRQNLGSPLPKFTYGIGNTFAYKNVDLSFFFNGVYGNKVVNFLNVPFDDPNQAGQLTQRAALNYAHLSLTNPAGSATDINNVYVSSGDPLMPRISGTDPNANSRFSSRYVENASFLRLQNVTFGYNLPQKLLSKIGVRSFKAFASATNLFTITKYTGYDPEVGMTKAQYSASSQNPLLNGIDPGRYPSPRIYSIGFTLGL